MLNMHMMPLDQRTTTLESSSFRLSEALMSLTNSVNEFSQRVTMSLSAMIDNMNAQFKQAEIRQKQLEERIDNMESQLNSIEMLLQRLVTKIGA